jgi:plasmid stabilization system protein ParE
VTRRSLVVTAQARRDLTAIVDWYRTELGSRAAAKALRSIRAGFVAATRIEPSAAQRADLPEGYYRVVAKAHLVIFQIVGDETRIVRVVHGARDLPPLLRR